MRLTSEVVEIDLDRLLSLSICCPYVDLYLSVTSDILNQNMLYVSPSVIALSYWLRNPLRPLHVA